jgi:hypothetical protein
MPVAPTSAAGRRALACCWAQVRRRRGRGLLWSRGLLARPNAICVRHVVPVDRGIRGSGQLLMAVGLVVMPAPRPRFHSMAQTLVQLYSPRGRLIGLYNMSSNGLRSFSGLTVGVLGSLIGIHWSVALSAMALLASCFVLLAFAMRAA